MERRAVIAALLLMGLGVVLGTTVFRTDIARATGLAQPPQPVREQNLDGNGNMKYTVDFRSLYATVLDRWLGQDPAATDSLLGATYARLGFL